MSAPEAAPESSRTGKGAELESSRAGKEEAKPESSRAGKKAQPEAQRKWVALLSAPVLLDDDDDQDMRLEVDVPPRPSRLLLRNRCARDPRRRRATDEPRSACIIAAAAARSARVLVQYGEGGIIYLFDTDANGRTVTRLPPVPPKLRSKSLDISLERSIALNAHPYSASHFVVAQLHPGRQLCRPGPQLLWYSTFSGRWTATQLTQAEGRTRDPSAEHGVVAHDGRLWWLALAYGLFYCDPLGVEPLRFLPLPGDCEMGDDVASNPRTTTLVKQRRCVRVSEGKLCFVEIRGLSYDVRAADDDDVPQDPTVRMWTLVDPEGPDAWKLECEAPFADIWDDKSYTEAGLPRRKVPRVAFVDLDHHCIIYFFLGSDLFGVDVRERQVVAYCKSYAGDREHMFHRPVVDAWELSPPTPTLERAFPPGTHIRLRVSQPFDETSEFVEASDDGTKAVVSSWGSMPQWAWTVDYAKHKGTTYILLQSSAYGRYLAGQEAMEPRATVMVDYQHSEQEEVFWKIKMEPGNIGKGFLVNCKYGAWDLSSEPCTMEAILSVPTPPRPIALPAEKYYGKWRIIRHFRANDAGIFDEHYGDCLQFWGCSLSELHTTVMQFQKIHTESEEGESQALWSHLGLPKLDNDDVLCVQPGSSGRLTPLVTDLPRSVERIDIVVPPQRVFSC